MPLVFDVDNFPVSEPGIGGGIGPGGGIREHLSRLADSTTILAIAARKIVDGLKNAEPEASPPA